ncbi:response regulator [Nitrospinota bacterium]
MAFILLADDDKEVQELVNVVLSVEGHTLMIAGDGREALSLMEEHDFDLLILDYLMPRMSGIEAYKEAKARDPQLPPALMLTVQREIKTIEECLKAGVKDYVIKPFKMADLAQRVGKLLKS